ncbi:MAG: hypothetical protein P4L61_01390 [Candidatus Pacebacteria bacterium]|nr:hypothetical protein [Candidatus Paceibacterota bacterium]
MTEVLINNFDTIMKARERVIWCMCAAAVCLAVCYGFFMERTIANTAALTLMQSTLAHEGQTVSDLSVKYVALSRGVTLDSALAQGFQEAPVAAFITVPAPASENPSLSINITPSAF